jgi:8-oxo-dGTP pyrophosphatase MutT (NUDIX family)
MNGASLALGAAGLVALARAARGARAFGHEGHWGNAGAGVLLTTGTKVLLLLRSEEVTEGGTWGTPGGAIEEDEDPIEAALRETEEEAGLFLDSDEVEFVGSVVYQSPGSSFRYITSVIWVPPEVARRHLELNWESEDAAWVTRAWLMRSKDDLHPGLQSKLDELLPLAFGARGAKNEEALPEEVEKRLSWVKRKFPGRVYVTRKPEALTISLHRHGSEDGYFRISRFVPAAQAEDMGRTFREAWLTQLQPEVWVVRVARLDGPLRSQGIEPLLYEALVLYALQQGAWVAPESCLRSRGVNFDTSQIWDCLRKLGKSCGPMLSLQTGSPSRMFFHDLTCPRCREQFLNDEDYLAHLSSPSLSCREAEALRKRRHLQRSTLTEEQAKERKRQREKKNRILDQAELDRVLLELQGLGVRPRLRGRVADKLEQARRLLRKRMSS